MKTIIGYSASGRVTNKALGKYMKRFNRIIGVFLTSFLGLTLAAKDPLESHLSKNQRCMSGMKALLYSAIAAQSMHIISYSVPQIEVCKEDAKPNSDV